MNKKLKKRLTKDLACAIIKAYQGREIKKEHIERRDADLSVNRSKPEGKTERKTTPWSIYRNEKGASPVNYDISEQFICFALLNR